MTSGRRMEGVEVLDVGGWLARRPGRFILGWLRGSQNRYERCEVEKVY
jgi:hypothetical protein